MLTTSVMLFLCIAIGGIWWKIILTFFIDCDTSLISIYFIHIKLLIIEKGRECGGNVEYLFRNAQLFTTT